MRRVLRPTDNLAAIVYSGHIAVVAAERWQRRHHSVLPRKPKAHMPGDGWKKCRATPVLSQRIDVRSLGNAGQFARIVFVGPCDIAVRSAKSSQVNRRSEPQFSVHRGVPRKVRAAGDPAKIVDATGSAARSPQRRAQIEHVVAGLVYFRLLILRA